ncbi:aminomethyltransferase [Arthrobacter sp. Hiyo8]|nr:aminomethyltransferase [Arthrobacter sp. Hiyo8]
MTENYTALYEEHKKLGASFTDFGGWQMPLKYSSELAEHHAVRNAAGLFDLSHMGEVWVTGPEAAAFLDYALVGKISAMSVGKAKYSLICQEDGGIIDDLITYRRGDAKFLVVPNAGNAKVVAEALAQRAANFDVVVEDASAATSLIAVQGPKAEAILLRLVRPNSTPSSPGSSTTPPLRCPSPLPGTPRICCSPAPVTRARTASKSSWTTTPLPPCGKQSRTLPRTAS